MMPLGGHTVSGGSQAFGKANFMALLEALELGCV